MKYNIKVIGKNVEIQLYNRRIDTQTLTELRVLVYQHDDNIFNWVEEYHEACDTCKWNPATQLSVLKNFIKDSAKYIIKGKVRIEKISEELIKVNYSSYKTSHFINKLN